MDKSKNNLEQNEELSEIYKIFHELYLKAPPVLKDLTDESIDIDYKEYIDERIDFKKIDQQFKEKKYCSITDVVKDIRHVFLNCYKFYGARCDHTIKTLKLEELLEHKINNLNENLKALADIHLSFNLLDVKEKSNFEFRYPKNCYESLLLRCVAHCRPERLKEYHKILSTTLTTNEDNVHTLEEIISWEKEIYFNEHYQYISSMWELPEIGNFVAIIFKELDFDIINQGEIERMFLMPKESITMSKIMTTLLMPIKKAKYIGRLMPYKIWSEKLSQKVTEWYKVYHVKNRNKVSVMSSLGIHPDFWAIVGDNNPLVEFDYCEISYYMKVWLVKGLCDYVTNRYKTINDIITKCVEREYTIWKNEIETEKYFLLNLMPDLRIYYSSIPYNEPNTTFLESENIKEDYEGEDNLSFSGNGSIINKNARVKPNEKHFKLIADSVQGLRSFLDGLDTKDTTVPENLINAFEDLIIKNEPEEYNLIVLNNNSKIKLFKEWKSYPERFEKDKEEILFWGKKNLKSTSLITIEETIPEKRQRKSVVKEGFDMNTKYEYDSEFSETDIETLIDFTDSEDEWGVKNQFKNKFTPTVQIPSKLNELEKQLKKNKKIVKQINNNSFDFDVKDTLCQVERVNKSINSVKKGNEVKHLYKTDTNVNGSNTNIVSSKNKDSISTKIFNDANVLLTNSENEKCIKSLVHKRKYIVENMCLNEQLNSKISKINTLNSVEIMMDNKLYCCDSLREQSPEIIISDTEEIKEQNKHSKSNLKNLECEIISLDDDDDDNEKIVISDDEDDVQILSVPPVVQRNMPTVKIGRCFSLNNNFNKSSNLIPGRRQAITPNCTKRLVGSTSRPKISPNVTIIPADVHLPKGIEVTMVKTTQTSIPSHFNATKRSTIRSNDHLKNNPSVVNVKCKIISKPNSNGEYKFYVSLPNGKLHPVSDELMNQYLKEHNNELPDYWLVPLGVDVAKQYGFN